MPRNWTLRREFAGLERNDRVGVLGSIGVVKACCRLGGTTKE